MDIKNILFNDMLIGFLLGVCTTFFCDFLKKQFYLHRKIGVPTFELDKCFTFSDSGDDRIFKILYRTDSFIKSEINFSYNTISYYAGLVLIPSNPFFRPYIKKGAILKFDILLFGIQSICLEFKANINKETNKVIGVYEIQITKKYHTIVLKDICKELNAWNDVTELVFLVKRYNVLSPARLEIENVNLVFDM